MTEPEDFGMAVDLPAVNADEDTQDETTNPGFDSSTTAREPEPSLEHLEALIRGVAAVVGNMQKEGEKRDADFALLKGEVRAIKLDVSTMKRLVGLLCLLVVVVAIVAVSVMVSCG